MNNVDELEVSLELKRFLKPQQGTTYKENSKFISNVMKGARKLMTLIDSLHEKLGHRAFELPLHFSPSFSDLSRLTNHDIIHIESAVEAWNATNEIQAYKPLSIALLLQLWRPNKSLGQIGESLGIRLFDQAEPNKLSEAVKQAEARRQSPTLAIGPMSHSDEDGEAGGLTISQLMQNSYADTETLPSQDVGLELDDEWSYAFLARYISTNGQSEHSSF
ncbi:uncharacterized protein FMAN_15527 [Fusarium mangiferae]|uniref:Uncharacterized protein n=1 Tax=Fusarium mangiferae TaxID=192010 RepID=A0A1L7ULL7_FUSMA|nr:uncharacterized protein FMAN_15527 [Fusarium mangiferae]CVL09373.1 uncharacterized protein FMAN_15527 [Fusarium mangiferae]